MKTRCLVLCSVFFFVTFLHAQSNSFTYQGRLSDNGLPANSTYDLRFTLYDAASGGNPVGAAITNTATVVSNGVFSVQLDFGGGAFNGSPRWVEVGVRPAGSTNSFTALQPLQPVTSSPYAIRAQAAATAATATTASNFTGTVSDSQLSSNIPRLNSPIQTFTGTASFNPASGPPFNVGNTNRVANLNADLLDGVDSTGFWKLGGNFGVSSNFIGTISSESLEFRAGNSPVLRLIPNGVSPYVVAGHPSNSIALNGIYGATIGGGGNATYPNRVSDDYTTVAGGLGNIAGNTNGAFDITGATVGGGFNNIAAGNYSTVPGGNANQAFGSTSFAAGNRAKANHSGTFVWADSTAADFVSTANNQFLIRAAGGVGINTTSVNGVLDIATGVGNVQIRNEAGLVPGINIANTGGNAGIVRLRNAMEIFPSDDATRAGYLDVRDTNGTSRVVLRSNGDSYFNAINGDVGIGTATPSAKLEIAGQIKITGGSPGEGKLLICDSNGLASWQPPSALSLFFGQSYSVLLPDVINNTAALEITGVMTGNVVVINGPGLDIQRVLGFQGTNSDDQPGPNMEYPFVFEYSGTYSNALQTWYQQYTNSPSTNRKSMSLIVKDLSGSEVGRWNMFEMGLTQIQPGLDGRKRYTLPHGLPPNNIFSYQRNGMIHQAQASKNPATDVYRIEIEGINQGGYPVTEINYTNRTITFTFDYVEGGDIYQWTKNVSQGSPEKKALSVITEVNGTEISRRNFFGTFPISYQEFTGFGQDIKLKERVVLSFDFWQNG